MSFSFDKSYWSAGPRDEPQYCSQQTLYDDLGKELLDHGFAGFNACILACKFHPYNHLWSGWIDTDLVKQMGRQVRCVAKEDPQCMLTFTSAGSGKSYR